MTPAAGFSITNCSRIDPTPRRKKTRLQRGPSTVGQSETPERQHALTERVRRQVESSTFPIRIPDNSFRNKNKMETAHFGLAEASSQGPGDLDQRLWQWIPAAQPNPAGIKVAGRPSRAPASS